VVIPGAARRRRAPAGISLRVRRGEIVGLAACWLGRTELLETLFGLGLKAAGPAGAAADRPVRPTGPRQALRLASPSYRRPPNRGLALEHSVLANTVLSWSPDREAGRGVPVHRTALTRRTTERLSVKLASMSSPVGSLSGGNQQKVVLVAAAHRADPAAARRADQGRGHRAKAEIYRLLGEIAGQGVGVCSLLGAPRS